MPGPTRQAVIAILTKHDLVAQVAQAVRDVGVAVRERTLRTPKEFGAFVDAVSGEQLGDIVGGTRTNLEVGLLLLQMVPGHRYVCVHSHPADDSFSPDDLALVLKYNAVCVISAVGRRGRWHVLSLEPDRPPPSIERVVATFNEVRHEVVAKYEQLARSGQMTRLDARSAATHELWERIAPILGLRYDRA